MDKNLEEQIINYIIEFYNCVPTKTNHLQYKSTIITLLWRARRYFNSIVALHQGVSQLVAIGLIRPVMEILIDALYLSIKKDNSLANRYNDFYYYDWLRNGLFELQAKTENERQNNFRELEVFYKRNFTSINQFVKENEQENLKKLISGKFFNDETLIQIYKILKTSNWRPNNTNFKKIVEEIDKFLQLKDMNKFLSLYRFYYQYPCASLHSSYTDSQYYIVDNSYNPIKDESNLGMAISALPGIYRCFQFAAFEVKILSYSNNDKLDKLWAEIKDDQ